MNIVVLVTVGRGRRPALAAARALVVGEDDERNISVGFSVTGSSD